MIVTIRVLSLFDHATFPTIGGYPGSSPRAIVASEPNAAVAFRAAANNASRRHLCGCVDTQSAHEVRQLAMVLDAPEARGGPEHAEAGPTVNHVPPRACASRCG